MENVSLITALVNIAMSPATWLFIVVLVTVKKSIYFVPQNIGYVVYTFGKYSRTMAAGMNFKLPFIEQIAAKVSLKEEAIEIPSQSAITKDNITLAINGVLYIKVSDAAAAVNNIQDYKSAVINLAMTSMRNAIGSTELDDCFQKRDQINAMVLSAMSDSTESWGVRVIRYEIKDINPPESISVDMEKQMSAEREKRSVELTAEGFKNSEIRRAEGMKEARVLAAQAANQEAILNAQALNESQVLEATGKAEAIRLVAIAEAEAIRTVGLESSTEAGKTAVMMLLAQEAIKAHSKIAKEGTIILSDGRTGDNIGNTVAQAISVSAAMNK